MAPEALAAMGLEREQMTEHTRRPLPRRRLNATTVVLLTLLRLYVIVAIPLVAYTFVQALRQ